MLLYVSISTVGMSERNRLYFFKNVIVFCLLSCHTSCSLHHHAAAGQLCGRVDRSWWWRHHEMDQWENSQLHQLVSDWTEKLPHCELQRLDLTVRNVVIYFCQFCLLRCLFIYSQINGRRQCGLPLRFGMIDVFKYCNTHDPLPMWTRRYNFFI